jgi:hypothetical protein
MSETPPPFVLDKHPGCMLPVGSRSGLTLYIVEDEWGMKKYPSRFPIDLRLLTWDDDRVIATSLLIRMNRDDLATFDAWIDSAQPAGVRLLQALVEHAQIQIHFVNREIVRSLRTPNTLRRTAERVLAQISARGTWSTEEFERVCARLDVLYPTSNDLWWSQDPQRGRVRAGLERVWNRPPTSHTAGGKPSVSETAHRGDEAIP